MISEIFGFTPSHIFELTLPQFLMYARYANEQKAYKLDLRTVNDYVNAIFGKAEPKDPHIKKINKLVPTIECKADINDKINNVFNIRDARNSLRRKTGKKDFTLDEILKEVEKIKPSDKYKISDIEYNIK